MAVHRTTTSKINLAFAKDVDEGLSKAFKTLPSRYFYDLRGDKIFQEIMHMPEYYLTNCEYEIFMHRAGDLLRALQMNGDGFDLVEFGAGDGYKTRVLIKELLREGADFRYVPIDISGDVLAALKWELKRDFPDLEVETLHAEYFTALQNLREQSDRPKLVLFIGSSIGNFPEERTKAFLAALYEKLNAGDQVLLGYDLRKNPHVILQAYNDAAGITKRFNMNLLQRINRELGANFDLGRFTHYASYDPQSGFARSYLVSLQSQEVSIKALDKYFHFAEGECIHTEISRKYTVGQMVAFVEEAGFRLKEHFYDRRTYFVDTLIEKAP